MQRLKTDDRLAVATSRLHMKTLPIEEDIYCFDRIENIYDYSSAFMIRRNFSRKSKFNRVFDHILASGLIPKWDKDLQRRPNATMVVPVERVYSLDDFGPVVMYLLLIVLAGIAAFCAETIIYYRSHSVNTNRFWNLMEKWICGKRYYFLLSENQEETTNQKSKTLAIPNGKNA